MPVFLIRDLYGPVHNQLNHYALVGVPILSASPGMDFNARVDLTDRGKLQRRHWGSQMKHLMYVS